MALGFSSIASAMRRQARAVRGAAVILVLLLPHLGSFGEASARYGIGANKPDLAIQYLGLASNGDGSAPYRLVTTAMARKAMADARDAGVRYFRYAATGFAPRTANEQSHLALWFTDGNVYWSLIDQMMDDLDAHGIRVVPVFLWNSAQFAVMAGDRYKDFLACPHSQSWQLFSRYLDEFIGRYKHRKTVMFYELANEMNNLVDLDMVSRCNLKRRAELCEYLDNFSSDQLRQFIRRLAALIRTLDPSRPISSGFSVPRAAAETLRRGPEWKGKVHWRRDTLREFETNLKEIHADLDIISVHLYPSELNRRFGMADRRSPDLLAAVKQAADRIGKPLFIGEFGDRERPDGGTGSYAKQIIDEIVRLDIPYSAIWVWQYYQRSTHTTRDSHPTEFNIEPGFTDGLISELRSANEEFGVFHPMTSGMDRVAPRVVLTWPLECALLADRQAIHAVASDDRGKVDRVEFWVAGRQVASNAMPPYKGELISSELPAGEYMITAKAFDPSGNVAAKTARVFVRAASQSKACMTALEQRR